MANQNAGDLTTIATAAIDGDNDRLVAWDNSAAGAARTKAILAKDGIPLHGADVASATTTDLDAATGDLVDVTGTTAITGITLAEGRIRTVRFTGALTLTHGSSLILPGSANITTVAGDFAIFRGYAAGVVRCVVYSPLTVTGTGAAVKATSPTLTTPTIGVATATSVNKVTLTAPATGATLTVADGKTLTCTETTTLNRQSSTGLPVEFCIAASDESTSITTGNGKATFRAPYAFTITAVRASVTTAPTGSTIIIDINDSGTTILSTKLSIDATEKTSTTAASAAVISDTAIADDAEITIDFDQVGSTVAGTGVKVWILGYR